MSNLSGVGYIFDLPNYDGALYNAGLATTPFLSAIGGRAKDSGNMEFPCSSEWAFEAAAQPAITEAASVAGVTALEYVRANTYNTCQIFQKAVDLSYVKMANSGRLTAVEVSTSGKGYLDQDASNNVQNEMDWQVAQALKEIARQVEYSFLNGSYVQSTGSSVAAKTRGVISCVTTSTTNASSAALDATLLDGLIKKIADASNGQAFYNDPVIYVNSFQKQALTKLLAYVPMSRNEAGAGVDMYLTDFGAVRVQYHPFVPAGTLAFIAQGVCAPVYNPVPGKGRLFVEDLAAPGASMKKQIFGNIGLDHGPEWMHGTITSLATS